jgi:hypothetical protein
MSKKSNLVSTKVALARHCGMTRQALDFHLKQPGAPQPRSNGFWDCDEVVAWINADGAGSDGSEELKLKKLKQEVELNDIRIMREAGELLPSEWASLLFADTFTKIRRVIQTSDLSEAQKHELTEKIVAIDPDEFINNLRLQTGEHGRA